MYMIVALVYVLVSGVAIDEPLAFNSRVTFAGLDKCQAALQDSEFDKSRAVLSHSVLVSLPPLEDQTVTRTVAVTASCQEDNRL